MTESKCCDCECGEHQDWWQFSSAERLDIEDGASSGGLGCSETGGLLGSPVHGGSSGTIDGCSHNDQDGTNHWLAPLPNLESPPLPERLVFGGSLGSRHGVMEAFPATPPGPSTLHGLSPRQRGKPQATSLGYSPSPPGMLAGDPLVDMFRTPKRGRRDWTNMAAAISEACQARNSEPSCSSGGQRSGHRSGHEALAKPPAWSLSTRLIFNEASDAANSAPQGSPAGTEYKKDSSTNAIVQPLRAAVRDCGVQCNGISDSETCGVNTRSADAERLARGEQPARRSRPQLTCSSAPPWRELLPQAPDATRRFDTACAFELEAYADTTEARPDTTAAEHHKDSQQHQQQRQYPQPQQQLQPQPPKQQQQQQLQLQLQQLQQLRLLILNVSAIIAHGSAKGFHCVS